MAEEQPLMCPVDDEQWLDRASAQVLARSWHAAWNFHPIDANIS